MSLFSSSQHYLGLDIGTSAVKVVELAIEKQRARLVTYGYLEQLSSLLTAHTPPEREPIIAGIRSVQQAAHTTTHTGIAALPSFAVFSSVIHLPKMPKKELMHAVEWEAKKFVPMPLSEMVVDWKILAEGALNTSYAANAGSSAYQAGMAGNQAQIQSQPKEMLKILLTAAPRDLVNRYVETCKAAGLKLMSLETESFALARALVGRDPSPVMMIDIGATATTISIVVDTVPIINRSIDVGGHSITKAIAGSLRIDPQLAEQFKRDFGLSQLSPTGQDHPVPRRIEFMLRSIINEIRYILNQYHSQTNARVEKVVLAGGSAWLPKITDFLTQQLQLNVFIGDPWARVQYPPDLKPILQELGPRFAVAIGLALRGLETKK